MNQETTTQQTERAVSMADLIAMSRRIGAYPPRTHNNPLSRELTDREMEAKILASALANQKAEAKRNRKTVRKTWVLFEATQKRQRAAAVQDASRGSVTVGIS
jgi:hypothetical protein